MHWVKLPGQSLMARAFCARDAELRIGAAVLNGDTAPGIAVGRVYDDLYARS